MVSVMGGRKWSLLTAEGSSSMDSQLTSMTQIHLNKSAGCFVFVGVPSSTEASFSAFITQLKTDVCECLVPVQCGGSGAPGCAGLASQAASPGRESCGWEESAQKMLCSGPLGPAHSNQQTFDTDIYTILHAELLLIQ